MMTVISAIAGLVIGVIYITGVGTSLSNFLIALGGHNLFITLLITAVLCIIMGMGMPTAAIYVTLAVLVAPALVKLGIPPLASHLFIFYMGASSFITPPIALAAFAAGAIAKADPMIVGIHACRLGIVVFLVPFVFVYAPGLLLMGGIQDIIPVVVKSLFGLTLIAIALSGFLFRNLSWYTRIPLVVGAIALMIPPNIGIPQVTWMNIGGAVLAFVIFLWEWRRRRTPIQVQPVPGKP